MEIKGKLLKDIKDYCKLNNLNIDDFVNNLLKKAFLVEKYGDKPSILNKQVKAEKITVNYNFTCIFETEKEDIIPDEEEKPKKRTRSRKLS